MDHPDTPAPPASPNPAPNPAPTPSLAAPPDLPPPPGAETKATLLLVLMLLLVAGAIVFVLYARGAFEPTQQLVLVAEDSEGVVVGMDLTFSGFPIGRVRRIELAPDGNARIIIDVPRKDAHWLRMSSVFTLVRGLVGNTSIRAYSGILTDPPLPAGAERKVLPGDATAEIPQLVSSMKDLVQNLTRMTAADSALATTLDNVQGLTLKLNGPQGPLGALMGGEAEAKKISLLLDRSNALLARLDGLTAKADSQVFGQEGLMQDTQATVKQLNTLLGEARTSLKKVDGVLAEAQVVAANARVASTDLGALRAEVEASLRKVEQLVNEVNRRWPFARDTELKLP
ncbi:MlaD family protein [Aquabacterium sp.]|uniref:MlaD family protein n=1 Tax=Aquabacterium sp. TaxID=1872578 RepID=UPI002B998020|nr:MlaD family protein [Aquabacterium sp.]HSW08653.1 MlaD family protein [Aquabacterium sp.]